MKNTSNSSKSVSGRAPDGRAETTHHTVQVYEHEDGTITVTLGNKDDFCRGPYGGKETFNPAKKSQRAKSGGK